MIILVTQEGRETPCSYRIFDDIRPSEYYHQCLFEISVGQANDLYLGRTVSSAFLYNGFDLLPHYCPSLQLPICWWLVRERDYRNKIKFTSYIPCFQLISKVQYEAAMCS